MIKLEENQRIYTIKSDDKWYTCISDENGLVGYIECPYLSVGNGETTINMRAFRDDYEAIKILTLKMKSSISETLMILAVWLRK